MTGLHSFREGAVKADGFSVRHLQAGAGEPVVVLHGAGGIRVSRSHELLADRHQVVLLETPGFGSSPANQRSGSMAELALTMAAAARALGLERFHLMGNSFGAALALWLALQLPEQVSSLVLVSPAAIRPESERSTPIPPDVVDGLLYAHPERQPPRPPPDPEVVAKQAALVRRLIGPARDPELEKSLSGLDVPVLVLFGTLDRAIAPEMGRHYVQLLPNCHLVYVYDAAHALDADRPEAFAAVVLDFLERKEGFLVSTRSALLNP